MQNVAIFGKTKKLYFMTLLVIYLTDSLLFATNSSRIFLHGKRYAVIMVAIAMLLFREKGKQTKVPGVLVLLSISILTSSILAGRLINGYSYYTMIAILWYGYLFAEKYSSIGFAEAFCTIMRVIAMVSIACWLLSDFISSLSFLPTITNTNGLQYKFLFFTNIPMRVNHARRNLGPFWEPGAYQIYLVVALYFTMFVRQQKNKWFDVALFCTAALTTLSGAPLIPMLLLFVAYFLEKRDVKSFGIVMFFGVMFIALFSTGFFNEMLEKLSGDGEYSSMTYRMIALEGGIKGFLANPIFGSSPETNEAIKLQLAQAYLDSDYSSNANTFANFFAYYGVFVGLFMLGASYLLFRKYAKSKIVVILIFAAYFISTSNENMMSSLLIGVIAFLGYKKEKACDLICG